MSVEITATIKEAIAILFEKEACFLDCSASRCAISASSFAMLAMSFADFAISSAEVARFYIGPNSFLISESCAYSGENL